MQLSLSDEERITPVEVVGNISTALGIARSGLAASSRPLTCKARQALGSDTTARIDPEPYVMSACTSHPRVASPLLKVSRTLIEWLRAGYVLRKPGKEISNCWRVCPAPIEFCFDPKLRPDSRPETVESRVPHPKSRRRSPHFLPLSKSINAWTAFTIRFPPTPPNRMPPHIVVSYETISILGNTIRAGSLEECYEL